MTSFGATKVINYEGFMPTFKVQGQVYHLIGSLLPPPNENSKFLQIYFMGNNDLEIEKRCEIINGIDRDVVSDLQYMFHKHIELIKIFKTSLERMPSDNYQIIMKADKNPINEHKGRYNKPTVNEVAIVIVGTEFESRDIVIEKKKFNT